MPEPKTTMAQKVAHAASSFHEQRTGDASKAMTVVLSRLLFSVPKTGVIVVSFALLLNVASRVPIASAQSSALVAAYAFDEGAGTSAADASRNGHNGALANGANWSTTNKKNGAAALSLDGISGRVNINDSSLLDLTTGMTLEAWVRPTAISEYRTVILKEVPGELSYALYAADQDHSNHASGWRRSGGVSGSCDTPGTLPVNAWSHIATTYNGSALLMYLNGNVVRTVSVSGAMQTSTLPLRIGGNAIWGEYFRGQIDDVRIYNRPLSQSEIQTDMATPVSGSSDTTPPALSVTAPATGATIAGTVAVLASASDNVGVVGVQFKLDGANLGAEDSSSPHSVSWNTTSGSDGAHQLAAVARDAAGNTSTAPTITVNVQNADTSPPTVSITVPANGATVSSTIAVSASASDYVGVVGVQFKLDGANLGAEDISSPYSISWNTTSGSDGAHQLAATARDTAGNTTTAPTITVNVQNADTSPPAVSITAPANGATVSSTIAVSASASDNGGLVGVQFELDGANLGAEDTSSPYSASWNTTSTVNGGHSLTAVARDSSGNETISAAVNVTVTNGGGGTSLAINGAQMFQTMDGFGISANSASWNNGELIPAIDMLIDQNGSTIWRVIVENADWEATNDNADPNVFNLTYYNAVCSSAKFEELWALMAYLNSKGITNNLILNFMGPGPSWMGGSNLFADQEAEWVEMVAFVAYYARNNRGLHFGYFSPNNEPDWDGIEGIRQDQYQWPRVWGMLAAKFDAIGLSDLEFIGPDTAAISTGVNAYMPEILATPAVRAKLNHFAFHNYAGDSGGAEAALAGTGKNFWISEVSNIWDAMAHMSQGPSAILVWDGYDSVYNHAILAGRGTNPPNDVGNGPALLNYTNGTYTPRKPFYEFAQLFRFVPQGAIRVAATESNSNVTIFAFHHTPTGRVTLVGRNAGSSNVTFAGTLSNLPTVPSFRFYRTTLSENFVQGSNVFVTNNAFSFIATANSVFTLTYDGTPDTTPPTVAVTAPTEGAMVAGNVTLGANAADNIGVAGVQFTVDGGNAGAEDTTSPYSISWNSATITDGTHLVRAVARDGAGNLTTSAAVSVTIENADTLQPAVSMTAPTDGATVEDLVMVSAAATDNLGVAGVQFQLDAVNLGAEDILAPYALLWNSAATGNGTHQLRAVARDGSGNVTTSTPVAVTVGNVIDGGPPAVFVADPFDGATVSGTIPVSATALDDVGVVGVQFLLDGVNLGLEDTASPYGVSWNTTFVANGSHVLSAHARDAAGNITTSSTVSVIVSNTVSTGIVAAFAFNEGTGTVAADSSGQSNNGTLSGPTWTIAGRYGGALNFDGINDRVIVADAASLDLINAMTLTAWVRPTSVNGDWRTIVLKERGTTSLAYSLYAADGGDQPPAAYANIGGTDRVVRGASTLPLNQWTHVAVTYDGTTLRFYLNGLQAGMTNVTGNLSVSGNPLVVGGNGVWGEWFSGTIDEVRVYNSAISPTDIQSVMNSPL